MKVTRGLAEHKRAPYPVLTIGNFDGLHLGHQVLLSTVVEAASVSGGTPIVLTFDPHPVTVLKPDIDLCLLTTLEDKLARFQHAGIEEVLFLPFDHVLASLMPEEFVSRVLRDGVGVREVFVGEHFAFGKGRAGRIADLARLGREAGFLVRPAQPVRMDGDVISSSRIRQLLQAGDVRGAARCLGRPYELSGPVVQGAQRGQGLGWPTANLRLPRGRVIPADGVYATTAIWSKQSFESVSYIGTRPTFGAGERLIEVYLLDQRVDLYDHDIRVQFVKRLRGDLTFATAVELAARIDLDVKLAREALKGAVPSTADA